MKLCLNAINDVQMKGHYMWYRNSKKHRISFKQWSSYISSKKKNEMERIGIVNPSWVEKLIRISKKK